MSTVTRMIQTTTITSSLTYSNSFLPGLSAPTLACFLSILNIVSNQTDPFRRWVRLCSSSAQSLTASHLLSPSYFTANKNLVPYNGLLGPTWCRIWFISLTLSPILVLYAHSTPTTLASPSFPKYVRCSQDVCWLVLLLEQYFLYVPARQTPSPSSFLWSNVTPPMRTTLLTHWCWSDCSLSFLACLLHFTLFWSAYHYSCPHQPQNLPPSRSSIICDFEGLPSIFCFCARELMICSYMFLRWLAQVDLCKYM